MKIIKFIKCLFGFHEYRTNTPQDEQGHYMNCPQFYYCIYCQKSKTKFN